MPASPSAQDMILDAPAIATGELTKGDDRLKVALVSLQRTSERLVRLDLRVTALTETLVLTSYFGDATGTADGIALVDTTAGKKYLVVRDSEDVCVCTRGRSTPSKGEPTTVYAYFPAPPASTQAVDVLIPNMPPFSDVAITG